MTVKTNKPGVCIAALALLFCSLTGQAGEPTPLKVCAAEDEMPYSNNKGEGFENALAALLAKSLGRPLETVYWSDPRYYLRDFLQKGLCDVAMGVDTGDPRLLTSEPYYRSGYVFITRKQDGLNVDGWQNEALHSVQKIAFVPGTPAETMLRAIGRYNDLFNYSQQLVGYKSKRNQYVKYENEKLVAEVAGGNAGMAVLWGPAAARYVKQAATPLTMAVVPASSPRADGEPVQFHYSTSIAVSEGNEALLADINRFIRAKRTEIQHILAAEGMPLLPETAVGPVAKK